MEISLTNFILIGSVGVFWVCYDSVRKLLVKRVKLVPLLVYLEIGQALIYAIIVFATKQFRFLNEYWLPGVSCAILALIGTYFLNKALSVSPLNSVMPFLSFLPFFTVIWGIFILGENINLKQFAGLILLVTASLVINYKPSNGEVKLSQIPQTLIHNLLEEKGCVYMLITSFVWSLAIPFDKISMHYSSPLSHALMHASISSIIMLIVLNFFSRNKKFESHYTENQVKENSKPLQNLIKLLPILILACIIASSALITQFYAYQESYIAYVESGKRAISLIANMLVGYFAFKESLSFYKIIGTIVILFSTLMIMDI